MSRRQNDENRRSPLGRVVHAQAQSAPCDSSLTSTTRFGDMVSVNPAPDASAPAVPTGQYRQFTICR